MTETATATAATPHLDWGLPLPADRTIVRAWGARAILAGRTSNQYVDIVWNRAAHWPADAAPLPAWKAFLVRRLEPWLRGTAKRKADRLGYVDPASGDVYEISHTDKAGNRFGARACANRSYGYLYICAWQEAAPEDRS